MSNSMTLDEKVILCNTWDIKIVLLEVERQRYRYLYHFDFDVAPNSDLSGNRDCHAGSEFI